MSAIILILNSLTFFANQIPALAMFSVDNPNLIVVIASFITAATSMALIFAPKKRFFSTSLIVFLLFTILAAILTVSTGLLESPFVSIWVLVAIFAGIFGAAGVIPILLLISALIIYSLTNGALTINEFITVIFTGVGPLIAGIVIWHSRSERDSLQQNRDYKILANELTEVTSKSEVVINAIGDGVIAVDGKGIIQLINPAAQNMIGWGKQDALSLSYKSVLQLINQKNEPLTPAEDPIQQVLNLNQQTRANNLSLTTKSGKKVMISLVVSPIGEVGSGAIAVFRDITKEKTEEREQAEFISTASHEMRTPVASIEGYLGLAMNPQTAQVDARALDYIMKAHAAAEHLGHLFQDLLDISKADDGRMSNNPRVVNVVDFLHDIVLGLEQKATAKGLQITYKPVPEGSTERTIAPVYEVNLDNDHIREIANNLIENAIKYTPKGEIIVDVTGDDDRVVISVKDSGIGIPAEDMPHLFQKFYRVDNKDTREIGGTGLGLYLCRRLAENMGGRIWAESVYTKGSTFFVEFPRISNQEAATLREQEAIANQRQAEQKAYFAQQQAQETAKAAAPITNTASLTMEPVKPTEPAHNVPRGEALTPEQIAAYVAKQRALIAEQQAVQSQQISNQPQLAQTQPQPMQQPAPTVSPRQPVIKPVYNYQQARSAISIPERKS